MLTVGHQKIDTMTLAGLAVLTAGVAALSVLAPELMPWSFLALGVVPLLVFWALRWEVTCWAWLWVFSYGLLDWPSWRIQMPGFFNLTVPRLIFLTALLVFAIHFLLRPSRVAAPRGLLWAMLALLACCAASASYFGWKLDIPHPDIGGAPYFRFLGSLLLPYVMFFLVYNAARGEGQIRWALGALVLYGWYALYLSYLQYAAVSGFASARAWIWPAYINDPEYGIHFDRARGAFAGVGPQATLLVVLFYADLFVARAGRGWLRTGAVAQAVLAVPAIFFTGLRSGYLAFLLCGVVWLVWAGRRRFGGVKLAAAAVVLIVGAMAFWSNLTQTDRRTGGVAQRAPVVARVILLRQTWEMVREHPLTGVGFGHFVDAQTRMQRDPASLVGMTYGVLVNHNLFLNMLAETGPVGTILMILVLYLLFGESRQLYRKTPPERTGYRGRALVVLFWVVLVNYLTDAMFRDPLWDVFSNALFWSLAGLIVGANRLTAPAALPADASVDGAA